MFTHRFDWQDDEDPPDVYITGPNGGDALRVYEEPKYIGGDKDEPTSWKLGPFAESVLRAINVAESIGGIVFEMAGGIEPSQDDVLVSECVVWRETNFLKDYIESFRQALNPGGKVIGRADNE